MKCVCAGAFFLLIFLTLLGCQAGIRQPCEPSRTEALLPVAEPAPKKLTLVESIAQLKETITDNDVQCIGWGPPLLKRKLLIGLVFVNEFALIFPMKSAPNQYFDSIEDVLKYGSPVPGIDPREGWRMMCRKDSKLSDTIILPREY